MVGDARLLRVEARVGVYRTEWLVEELVSDVALRRRVATGILEVGDGRRGDRIVTGSAGCARDPSRANVDVAPPPALSRCGELKVEAGKRAPPSPSASMMVSTPGASSSAPSSAGIPKPGDATSCPRTTSPKKGCRLPEAGLPAGDATFRRVGDVCWSRLLLLPAVRRVALRGVAGAGCGLSLGFRLLNL